MAVFCTEEEVDQLFEALRAAAFVNWGRSLIIHAVPRYLLDLMQKLTEEKGAIIDAIPFVAFTYQPHLDTLPKRVGPGFRVCLLGRAGVHYLVQRAKYGGMAHLEVFSRLAQHVPFVGVYRDSGVTQDTTVDPNSLPVAGDEELPVAWVATTFEGAVGRLMTDEGYRRHGLGSLITTVTARRQAALLKLIPHSFVEASNAASIAMFTGLPGWKLTHDGVFWLLAGVTLQTYTQRQ
ncbi:uncharacterized protein LOC127002006 [Eriocheir sinensis]|uniref:uncharacterized protein LOC127002006 n=1 Tax=Eriocheir sinensis TaxID=95602 RepID=UPI0021C9FB5F|nr:uncharacterized protein LOC127002006 [Eriocheir sinensis]